MNKLKEINKSWDSKIEMIRSAGKPCHILNYCPYGSLVEVFEFSESEKSCKLFGHDCPMYVCAEPLHESLSAMIELKDKIYKRDDEQHEHSK